jgi:hypothetical protein
MQRALRHPNISLALVASAGLALSGLAALPASAATGHSITINDPARAGAPVAGPVELSGTVGTSETTTVLYLVDATGSTKDSVGTDCNGDGLVGVADDVNADSVAGDVLDCEIGAVRSLNANLSAAHADDVLVGVEAFANQAKVAALDSAGTEMFAAPGDTGGEAQPRIITAATSIHRGEIGRYVPMSLGSGHRNNYDSAVMTALGALGQAPAGPKWIVLLSDGQTSVADSTLAALKRSGAHLGSFAVGTEANCRTTGALFKMSGATGEACVVASSPATLAAKLTNAQPDGIAGVTVSIGDTTVDADIDSIGGWSTKFTLGAGSYKAVARARFTSGGTAESPVRSFSVRAAPGSAGPTPGSVTPGPHALLATGVKTDRPAPSRSALPAHVTGTVGLLLHDSLTPTKALNGAAVLLQGRKTVGAPWVTLDRDTVHAGAYALRWTPLRSIHLLRVSLPAHGTLAGSSAAVPTARISACQVKHRSAHWSMTCHTTAKKGSTFRLLEGHHVVARGKVASGLVKVAARSRPGGQARPHEAGLRPPGALAGNDPPVRILDSGHDKKAAPLMRSRLLCLPPPSG